MYTNEASLGIIEDSGRVYESLLLGNFMCLEINGQMIGFKCICC